MNIIIKKSKIQGKGVFANKDFKKGEIVLKWDVSHLLDKKDLKKIKNKDKRYISYYKNNKYIIYQSPEKFVNHSCDANTKAKDDSDVAIREISKGEEITANYINEKVPNLNMKCNCGSKKCIKILNTS